MGKSDRTTGTVVKNIGVLHASISANIGRMSKRLSHISEFVWLDREILYRFTNG